MWYLKFKYIHNDCIYAPKLKELGLSVFHFGIGNYIKGNYVYTSIFQKLIGKPENINRYFDYLKQHKQIIKIESSEDTTFILARHNKDLDVYNKIYSPELIYVMPSYLSKEGFEIVELACWSKEPLNNLIKSIEKSKTTEYFKILQFKDKKLEDIYISKLLPKLPEKQEEAIKLAFNKGYYEFPRKINLDDLAKLAKVSKQTFRENLRKAEIKLLPLIAPK